MKKQHLNEKKMERFHTFLLEEERGSRTVEKYMRDIRKFYEFLGSDKQVTKETVMEYKESLRKSYKISSANSMIASLNCMFEFLGWCDCKVRSFRNQKQMFCEKEKELSKEEYCRLVDTARAEGNERLAMVLQTICGTGIRISELESITVEAAKAGKAVVVGKGKRRVIFLPKKLRIYLQAYCRRNGIASGPVFRTRSGRAMDRSNIWLEMKKLGARAKVNPEKVFPHNLRHLFARTCYKVKKDIVYLADILGHSSIETTRIYTISSGQEHMEMLSQLELVI